MKKTFWIIVASFVFALTSSAQTNALSKDALKEIQFDQKLGQTINPNLAFVDDNGAPLKLAQLLHHRPIILMLGYYKCPMLCSLVLNGLVESMQDLKATAGDKFEIVFVGISESETPDLARAKKRTYLKRYGRRGFPGGWHFLTGTKTNIEALANEVGFRYAYDPASKEFAHPSGLIVLTPDGKISRYFFGVEFKPSELNAALKQAGSEEIGSPIQQLLLLCFHYNPITGKYGMIILNIMRVAGLATFLGLGLLIFKYSPPRQAQTKSHSVEVGK